MCTASQWGQSEEDTGCDANHRNCQQEKLWRQQRELCLREKAAQALSRVCSSFVTAIYSFTYLFKPGVGLMLTAVLVDKTVCEPQGGSQMQRKQKDMCSDAYGGQNFVLSFYVTMKLLRIQFVVLMT